MPRKDPEERRQYQREYIRRTWLRHLEHSKEAMRRWRANNPEKRLARDRAYKQRHPEQVRAGHKRYREKYPEKRRTLWQRRRARELGAPGNFTSAEWMQLLVEYEHRCAYCGCEGPLQADHRVPLSRGGSNDITNILPACGLCNQRKGAMNETEFRKRLRDHARNHRKIDDEAAG